MIHAKKISSITSLGKYEVREVSACLDDDRTEKTLLFGKKNDEQRMIEDQTDVRVYAYLPNEVFISNNKKLIVDFINNNYN